MAGLGEVCTHVAALLFSVEFSVRGLEERSVTGVAAYWAPPSLKRVQPQPVDEMDFSTPLVKLRKLQQGDIGSADAENNSRRVLTPDDNTLDKVLFSALQAANSSSAMFLVMPKYALKLKPGVLIKSLASLYEEALEEKSLAELQDLASEVEISITAGEAEAIEKEARGQSRNKLWKNLRIGRITASNFKRVCLSLIHI